MNVIFNKIGRWFKPIVLSTIFMLIPYRIAFRSLNDSNFLVVKSLFWQYDERILLSPLRLVSSLDVLLAVCILAVPPIWFSGITSARREPRIRIALSTCIIEWLTYVILVPAYLFEYSPLEEAPDTWLNLTFFVTLTLLLLVIIPTLLDYEQETNQSFTKKQVKVLILISLIFPLLIVFPIGETLYSIRIESISWLFLRQSILTDLPIDYYYLSDFIFEIQPAPRFPIGVLGWIFNFAFIYQLTQYSRGYSRLRSVLLLGFCTLIPTLLNNVFLVIMRFQPSSIIHFPIPSIFLAGLLILRKIKPPLISDSHLEEVEIPVPLLHRIRSRLWRKEK